MQKDQKHMQHILDQKHIALTTIEVFQASKLLAKTSAAISQADAVIILKDNTVVSGLEVLVKLCERFKIPLMASDLDSPDRGAAFGYGVYEIEFGKEAAKKALDILEHGTQPGLIPVTPVSSFTLRINEESAKKQGFSAAMIYSIIEQALIALPLVIGGYLILSLLKLPDFSIESAYLFGAVGTLLFYNSLPFPIVLASAIGAGCLVALIVTTLNQFLHIPYLLAAIVTNNGLLSWIDSGITSYVNGKLSPYLSCG